MESRQRVLMNLLQGRNRGIDRESGLVAQEREVG